MEPGTLFAAIIGERCGIRAIKARAEVNKGELDDFFVIVGPFDNETGQFPTLHHHDALYTDSVLEMIDGYRISPSLSPDDFLLELPLADDLNGVILILQDNQILMSVANFDSAGRIHRRWLDVGTGEILLPIRPTDYIITRRWWITAPVENSAPETIFEFNAETEND